MSDIWGKLHIISRPVFQRNGLTRQFWLAPPLWGQISDQLRSVCSASANVYNWQVHCPTVTTPFSVVLLCHPQFAVISDPPFSILTNTSKLCEPPSLCKCFLQKLAALQTHTDRTLKSAQARFKRYFDMWVFLPQSFHCINMFCQLLARTTQASRRYLK